MFRPAASSLSKVTGSGSAKTPRAGDAVWISVRLMSLADGLLVDPYSLRYVTLTQTEIEAATSDVVAQDLISLG